MSEELIREYEERDEDESGGSGSEDENRRSTRDNLVEFSDTEETKKSDDEKGDKNKDDKPDKERRRSTKPRVTLNDRILKNPKKGITKIETYFENFNFLGKGHEKEDLDRVMKRLEHWSHRLFPMYNFDDFLEKTEQIGLKRLMSAYVEKYRTDMLEDEVVENEEDEPSAPVVADDPFDDLLLEHAPIRRQISQAPKVPLSDEVKERMERNRLLALEKKKAREAERQRQAEEARMQNLDSGTIESQDSVPVQHSNETEVVMSLEERIEMKRQMALAKKLARQKEMEQSKAAESQVVDEQIQDKIDESSTVVEKDCQLNNQAEDVLENLDQGSKGEQVEETREEEKIGSMEVTEEVDGSSEKMDV